MTKQHAPISFSDLLLNTRQLMIQLTALQQELRQQGVECPRFVTGIDYDPVDAETAHLFLEHIEFALDLIGTTFNACLNQEGLAAFYEIVQHVEHALQDDWVQEILAATLFDASRL